MELLKDESDPPVSQRRSASFRPAADVVTIEAVRPGVGSVEAAEQIQQRRFAGAGRAGQRHELAPVHGQRQTAQHRDVLALTVFVGLRELVGFGQVLLDGRPAILLDDLTITVVGPSRAILDRLKREWLRWLGEHRASVAEPGPVAAAAAVTADGSLPNLSSIVLLVELAGRSILLTGDARSDQILAGMREAGLLDEDGRRHVSVLKMPHHGSIRNVTAEFLQAVSADSYVVSADGRYGNPDYEALALTVETAHARGRPFELALTNATPSSERLLTTHPPATFGYRMRVRQPGAPALNVDARARRGAREESWTG